MARKIKNYAKKNKNKEKENLEKLKQKEEKKREIKSFSLQSAICIIVSSIIGSIAIPLILSLFKIEQKMGIFIGSTFFTSFGFTWTRFFIDSKEGYTKRFWKQYLIFVTIFGIISYFWIFRGKFI